MYFYYGKIKSNISSSIPASNLVNTSLQRREVLPGVPVSGLHVSGDDDDSGDPPLEPP